jgi:hypothetical protein
MESLISSDDDKDSINSENSSHIFFKNNGLFYHYLG